MTYFITGATGFIGSHIARMLIQKGRCVVALKRPQSQLLLIEDIADQIQWIDGDILDVTSLEEAVKQAEYVIHAAGVVSFGSKKMRQQMAKVNIEGTQNVVNTCLALGKTKKLCYLSSVAAIGRSPDREWVDEKGKWADMEDHSFYGYTKYQGELEVWRGTAEGLSAVIVNPSIVLGTGSWDQSSLKLFKYGYEGSSVTPRGELNYVDVRDIAQATLQLLEGDVEDERFILSAGHIPYREFFPELHQRFGNSVKMVDLKPWMAALARIVGSIQSAFGGKPLINKETISSGNAQTKFDGQKVTRAIPFQYAPLSDTLDWACAYFKEKADQ